MTDDETLERYSRPGHDRDCLRAMWSQAGQAVSPLSQVQVKHLLMIGWSAGATAEHEAMHEGVTEDCRSVFDYAKALAQTGHSGTGFVESVARVYGPTLSWRRRFCLAVYMTFRKGYQP